MNYDIIVKTVPAYKVLSLRDIIPTYQEEGRLWKDIQAYTETNKITTTEPCCAIYHDVGYKENDVDVEVIMGIKEDVGETDRIKMRELETVPEMAIVFHKGPFEEMSAAYHGLGVWMSANHYEMNGPTRAIYHKGPWCEKDPENYLTELQAPLMKKK